MPIRRKLLFSLLISIVMLVFSYWVTNLHFPVSGEKEVISIFEAIRGLFWSQEKKTDDVLLVDVLYDKELITKTDELGMPLGDGYAITDRSKLQRLLQQLKDKKDYGYILLDVAFEKDEETDADSLLYATIGSMDRIVIACDSMEALPDIDNLRCKAALAHYYLTPVEADFVKYPYLFDEGKSMPLKFYEDSAKRTIERHGIFYTDGCRLARRSIVLNINYIPDDSDWMRLGDVLYDDMIGQIETKGKLIVIGSSKESDVHATYRGPVSGAVINLNACKALLAGHHEVSLMLGVLLFVSFFIFSYAILSHQSVCSWGSFSLFLSVLCILTYCFMDEVYDIFITSTAFWIIKKIVNFKDKRAYAE